MKAIVVENTIKATIINDQLVFFHAPIFSKYVLSSVMLSPSEAPRHSRPIYQRLGRIVHFRITIPYGYQFQEKDEEKEVGGPPRPTDAGVPVTTSQSDCGSCLTELDCAIRLRVHRGFRHRRHRHRRHTRRPGHRHPYHARWDWIPAIPPEDCSNPRRRGRRRPSRRPPAQQACPPSESPWRRGVSRVFQHTSPRRRALGVDAPKILLGDVHLSANL